MLLEIFLLLAAIVAYFYLKFKSRSNYWSKKGIWQPDWNSFPLGNNPISAASRQFGYTTLIEATEKLYKDAGDVPYFGSYGMLGKPILMLKDLDLIKAVMGKQRDKI